MADIYRIPDERQIFREASEWMARLQGDDVTTEERANFETWRGAHPSHRRTFDELTGTWNRFAAARPLVRAVTFGQLVNDTAERAETDQARRRKRYYRVACAAALATIVVGLGVFNWFRPSPGRTYVTTIGEHATVSLPDGSTLELDSESRARVDFSTRYRIVHLDRGEAFFKVAHNAAWPFWVVGDGSWVSDVGTTFNVQLNATGMRVTVSEGTVKVGMIAPLLRELPLQDAVLSRETALSVLTAGDQADLSGNAVKIQPLGAAQLARAIAWRARTLYFENAPLSEIAAQLGRYTPLRLVISGESLRQLPMAGTFEASPRGVETFLAMLNQGLGLTVHRHAGEIVIEPADGTTH